VAGKKREKPEYTTLALVRDLAPFVRPYWRRFALATASRGVAEALRLYPGYAVAAVATFLASYQVGQSFAPVWLLLVGAAASGIVASLLGWHAGYAGDTTASRVYVDTRLAALRHVVSLDIAWHHKESSGVRLERISRGAQASEALLRLWVGSIVSIAISIVGSLAIISIFDRTIALVTAGFLIVFFAVSRRFSRIAVAAKRAENQKFDEFSGLVHEAVGNVRSVKVMSMAEAIRARLSQLGDELYALVCTRKFWFQTSGSTKTGITYLFRTSIIAYVAWGIAHGQYEIGFLLLIYGYFMRLTDAVYQLSDVAQDFEVRKQDMSRLSEIFAEVPTTDAEEGKRPFPKDWKKIELVDVSFSYGDKKVLDRVSFVLNRGERLGVVGLSGAGKSTLFKLLLKEHEGYTGEILIDGVPLRSIGKKSYFKHVSVVLQETEVFNFSLRDNVTISNFGRDADEALLERALEVSHVAEFASVLPQKLDTLIGEKGVRLSGGEKQRVGIARAVFKEPELLLLDEATSHLDVESEAKIQQSLHEFFQTVTAIVIAHRLTTIKEMNRILVLEDGRVVEEGSFAELRAKKGRFDELWQMQQL
jgi:ATP-binding cassette subfamily B protein